ncbi:hypothetical protein [Flavitalea sp.]|nr:hypothetical protein [Flavitalea sp.]
MGDQLQFVNGFTVIDKDDHLSITIDAEELIQFLANAPRLPDGSVQLIASKHASLSLTGSSHLKPVVADEQWQPIPEKV